jgi:O-antigen/teichoic acid export membrane protein
MLGRAGLGFLQVAILARLLEPADFGMMAIVAAVIAFAQIFSDMGVSNAIVHHQRVSQEELSSLYWLNVLAGAGMTLLLLFASPLIAWFYGAPSLQPLLMVVSISFLVVAIAQQLRVVAEKELRFAELARIELAAAIFGFVTAVAWALNWPSVFALVAGMIASNLLTTILSWRSLANGWRPMRRLKLAEIRHFLGFGGYTMANNLVNTFNMQADIFIGGRFLSAPALGVYSLPRDLSLRVAGIINPIVTRVGLPVMAKAQHDQTFLKNVYLKTLRMTASVNFPIYLALAVFAPEVVALLFGPQWGDAVPLLRILALWGLLRSTGNPVGSLIFAVGRADLAFKWNLAMLLVVAPVLWFGVQHGDKGMVIALLAMAVVLAVPGWYVLVRPLCGAGFTEYFQQLLTPLMVGLLSSSIAYVAISPFGDIGVRLGLGLSIGGLSYLILSRLFNRIWYEAMAELLRRAPNKSLYVK